MPLFYFVLKTGRESIPDPEGQELADETAARLHGVAIARQLMQHREADSRTWRIQVCDDYLHPLFEVFFAEVDETFDAVPLRLQASIEDVVRTATALDDSIIAMRATLKDTREILVKADRILASMPRVRL
jgi:hypothetical protein